MASAGIFFVPADRAIRPGDHPPCRLVLSLSTAVTTLPTSLTPRQLVTLTREPSHGGAQSAYRGDQGVRQMTRGTSSHALARESSLSTLWAAIRSNAKPTGAGTIGRSLN